MEAGTSSLLIMPLEDKTNENSCVLTSYEVGPLQGDGKLYMTNLILMQYLNEPFFDDLRTKQQLGYVVFSRSHNHRDVIGCQFLVQSSHKACEYLINSINVFLVDLREKLKALTDDELEVQKQAVITKLAVKDINLGSENGRLWGEIATHEYLFDRQDREIEIVKNITKDEFQAHFEKVFFSDSVKRLDMELTSTAHEEQ